MNYFDVKRTKASSVSKSNSNWMLTEFGSGLHQSRSYLIPMPDCIVGRSTSAGLRISDSSVSKQHARLFTDAGQLFVEDLGSTNGTYVNNEKVQHSALVTGDLLQFANSLYKVCVEQTGGDEGTMEQGPETWAGTLLMFYRLMSDRAVKPYFQPIVKLENLQVDGNELLARSDLDELRDPASMFGAAERLGQQAALSELMRDEGSRVALGHPVAETQLYYNTHSAEFGTDRLDSSLRDLRQRYPTLPLTIEIHEAAITQPDAMRKLRALLTSLDMRLAYDDFGAGQGRLVELTEVPADVLKFDMQLIRNIDSASATRQELLRSLVRVSIDSGSVPLAEGVETEAEHKTCIQLGFQLGQGYYYGRPAPI
ncbi:putative membrane protein YjcC [Rubripirellula lacrimiformis]|uniref:Putative membrane protein YjcC n=1 Tax=Rubripirellula lacrimiformis TaxID=1930273 RepID=A0A517NBV4_9BACT|nr:EAL domain-containing protein [Rubripirellula lacrimiformis]QDT04622.1 putative membrane protein YjcC [Rubripirellula lacrimiformis]